MGSWEKSRTEIRNDYKPDAVSPNPKFKLGRRDFQTKPLMVKPDQYGFREQFARYAAACFSIGAQSAGLRSSAVRGPHEQIKPPPAS
jgi:hypothetical protein